MQALPRQAEVREAALAAVEAATSAPWALAESFMQCTKKDTQKMFMAISGTLYALTLPSRLLAERGSGLAALLKCFGPETDGWCTPQAGSDKIRPPEVA